MSKKVDLNVAHNQIKKSVAVFTRTCPSILRGADREDLVNEIFCHFLEKKFFEKYDSSITSFEYFVARAAKNNLIDMTRKKLILNETSSLNIPLGDEGNNEIIDIIPGKCGDPETAAMMNELAANLPEENISVNYSLTWKGLFEMVISGLTPKEIGSQVIVKTKSGTRPLSTGRTSQLIGELRKMVGVYA